MSSRKRTRCVKNTSSLPSRPIEENRQRAWIALAGRKSVRYDKHSTIVVVDIVVAVIITIIINILSLVVATCS